MVVDAMKWLKIGLDSFDLDIYCYSASKHLLKEATTKNLKYSASCNNNAPYLLKDKIILTD
jgi:hypothetical protein